MIEIDMKRVKAMADRLDRLNAKGIPFAQRNTINDQAFATQKEARATIRSEFVTRNNWTQRSVKVERARSTRDSAMVGSTEKYMADQEFGATGGPTNVPMPASAGQSNRARTRTRVVRKSYRMNAIQLKRRRNAPGNQAQRNIAAVRQAKDEGRKFVYLERGRVKGIYRVMGSKKKPKTRMVQNLTRRVRVVRRHPWLYPSTQAVGKQAQRMYAVRLREQLVRLR